LKFNQPVLDHLAYALPAGIAVTRLGCLFSGCCFGTPTGLPWGIQYDPPSHAFHTQVTYQLIPATSALSLPVHPTQVYNILFCLVILLLVYLTRNKWKVPENRFLFAIIGYASFRFVEEFFRESTRSGFMDKTILGVKGIQLMLLGTALILAYILMIWERRRKASFSVAADQGKPVLYREYILFATVPAFLTVAGGWLDPFEKLTLWLFTFPLLMLYLKPLYIRLTTPALRWKMPLILLTAFLTMNQDTINQKTAGEKPDYKGWWSIGAFGSLGQYEERYYDCDGNITQRFDRNYSTWGAGASYHYKPFEDHHLTAGFNVYSASDCTDEKDEFNYTSPAMNAFISYDLRYAGASLGMNVFFDYYQIGDITPMFSLWAGKKDVLFGEVGGMTDFYQMGEPGLFSFGLGSGLGQVDRSMIRADLCLEWDVGWFGESSNSYISGLNLAGNAWINDRVTLKASVFLGRNFGGSFGLHVHIGDDRWKARR
jgi:phosphatidylglycerol:prolipoprotein diacylglycerol transferase